jgi:Ca2+:H+ antiporter
MSQLQIGFILIPIVLNLSEAEIILTLAIKDKIDLAIGVAFSSSLIMIQLCLPLLVIIGLGAKKGNSPDTMMTFDLNNQLAIWLGGTVLLVTYLIAEGSSNW